MGILLLVVGLFVLILFAAADILGLGENPNTYGSWQIAGSILGAILITIGLLLFLKKNQYVPKVLGIVPLAIGLLILILFLVADIFTLGENPKAFGSWQIGGSVIGSVLTIIGLVLLLKKKQPFPEDQPGDKV